MASLTPSRMRKSRSILAGVEEEAIGRGHGQHLAMAGLHQILHDLIQGRDNAGGEGQLLTGKIQS